MPPEHVPQILLDLSELLRHDARSGVQRVTRGILQALLTDAPAGYQIRPVYAADGYYAYALPAPAEDGSARYRMASEDLAEPIRVRSGDIFLGLDLALEDIVRQQPVLASLQHHGVKLYFFLHDILPLRHPEWFHAGLVEVFAHWLNTISAIADGLICNSRATADDVLDWLDQHPPRRARPLPLGYAHLGADLAATAPSQGIAAEHLPMLQQLGQHPTLLMVGTIEPRKMQGQALDALELLWQAGDRTQLVIVGKPGWRVEALLARLQGHPQRGRQLFWLEHASDELLEQLYQRSTALLAASLAEGFGLPLVEASRHQLAVIARDLPVFREIAGEHAWYFSAQDGRQLADELQQWLTLHASGNAPRSAGMPHLNWSDSARQLLANVLEQAWYRQATIRLP